jgi:hypothetical protein
VKWNLAAGELQVDVPAGTTVRLDLARLQSGSGREITLDGRPLRRAPSPEAFVDLTQGNHHVRF